MEKSIVKTEIIKSEVINTAKELVLPRNETESLILNIWTKYFDRKDISVTDDFFDIGGHSLLAATIISNSGQSQGYKVYHYNISINIVQ